MMMAIKCHLEFGLLNPTEKKQLKLKNNKMKKKKIIFSVFTILVLIFLIGGFLTNKYYNQYIKSQPKMYCYEYFRGTKRPVPVLMIEDLDLKEPYLRYYYELKSGVEPILSDKIPLKTVAISSPVYVLEYTSDSLLAKVVSYFDMGGKFGGSFHKGWVYSETLHQTPPEKP